MSGLLSKIDVSLIVRKHLETLVNDVTGKVGREDWFMFLIFPILLAVTFLFFGVYLNKDFVSILCSILAIFVGLFFNVIVLIFDLIKREENQNLKNALLSETLINITFSILLAVICIISSLLGLMDNIWIKKIFNFITYFFCTLFTVTLLMILKRTFVVFYKEIEDIVNK